jgi:hypothetical protein
MYFSKIYYDTSFQYAILGDYSDEYSGSIAWNFLVSGINKSRKTLQSMLVITQHLINYN